MPNTSLYVANAPPPKRTKGFLKNLTTGFAQNLPQGLEGLAQNLQGARQGKIENEALRHLTGKDFSGISPDIKKLLMQNLVSSQSSKQQEKLNAVNIGLKTIEEMKEIKKRGHLGTLLNPSNLLGLATSEGRSDRSQYEQLGRSLIPLVAANVSIRNQKEFEEYRKIITDPSSTEASIEGALEGLEKILRNQLEQADENFLGKLKAEKKKISREEAQKIFKEAGEDAAKARKLALEKGYEF
jgi:hypothetical protein